MSSLNFNRKSFLELEELNRFQEFLQDNTVTNAILGNTTQYGIIQTNFIGADTNFQVGNGTNVNTIKFAKDVSQAIDIDGRLIRLLAKDNIEVTDDNQWYWIRISYTERRNEIGTVSVNVNGEMTGTNTLFTEVLRGQSTDAPVKIKFTNEDGSPVTNTDVYEVVRIIDDTNAILTSTATFIAESNLLYTVIGTTPIGSIISPEQLTGVYIYDSCLIEQVLETVVDTPPALPVGGENRYFYVARVKNNGGAITIQDKRDIDDTYWKFAVPGVEGAVISKTLPAPANEDEYAYIGSMDSTASCAARFFIQGVSQGTGDVLDVRVSNYDLGGGSWSRTSTTRVIFGGAATGLRPTVYIYENSGTNKIDVYLKTGATDTGRPYTTGYISLIGTSGDAGTEIWEYPSAFTWGVTPPTPLTISAVTYGVYANDKLYSNYNDTITTINSTIAGLDTQVSSNTSIINSLSNDSGWLNVSRVTGETAPSTDAVARKIGNVVEVRIDFQKANPPSTPTGPVIVLTMPGSILGPTQPSGGPNYFFFLNEDDDPTKIVKFGFSGQDIYVFNIEDLSLNHYRGNFTYLLG